MTQTDEIMQRFEFKVWMQKETKKKGKQIQIPDN